MRVAAIIAALGVTSAAAGAWPQDKDYGLSINGVGIAQAPGREQRLLFEGYGEAGLGSALTAVFSFESEMTYGATVYSWRAGGGLRWSFSLEDAAPWRFAVEARASWQDFGTALGDPVFAGDGLGGLLQADAGRSFDVWGVPGFVNFSAGWAWRGNTADEWRVNVVAGFDVDEDWQVGLGYFSTSAPGDVYDPGVYEKHEAQVSLRWRLDADYALAVSAAHVLSGDRVPTETTLRVALWTFFYPEPDDG